MTVYEQKVLQCARLLSKTELDCERDYYDTCLKLCNTGITLKELQAYMDDQDVCPIGEIANGNLYAMSLLIWNFMHSMEAAHYCIEWKDMIKQYINVVKGKVQNNKDE